MPRKRKSKVAQHIFLIAVIVIVIIALPIAIKQLWPQNAAQPSDELNNTPTETNQPAITGQAPLPTNGETSSPAAGGTPSSDGGQTQTPSATAPQSPSGTVGEDYFKDALFIGDSRTVGLYQYSNIKDATYFADTGMQVFNVMNKELDVPGKGRTNLENLLKNNSFKKIYIMLGINELGYPSYNSIVSKYSEILGTIKSLCPDAIIYVQANLHVTKSKSDGDDIYNNANIDRLNSALSGLADNQKIFYIDVNVLFDDENHALDPQYSADGSHPLGKYYMTWGDWLYTQAVAVS